MSMSSSTIVALSQNSNRNLESLPTMAKGIKGFRQQIEDEMQALVDQGLRRLGRIKEMLVVGENVQEMTLEYTWATWQYVIQEET